MFFLWGSEKIYNVKKSLFKLDYSSSEKRYFVDYYINTQIIIIFRALIVAI